MTPWMLLLNGSCVLKYTSRFSDYHWFNVSHDGVGLWMVVYITTWLSPRVDLIILVSGYQRKLLLVVFQVQGVWYYPNMSHYLTGFPLLLHQIILCAFFFNITLFIVNMLSSFLHFIIKWQLFCGFTTISSVKISPYLHKSFTNLGKHEMERCVI